MQAFQSQAMLIMKLFTKMVKLTQRKTPQYNNQPSTRQNLWCITALKKKKKKAYAASFVEQELCKMRAI